MRTVFFVLLLIYAASALRLLPGLNPVPGTNMGFGAGYDVKIERVRMPLYQYTYEYNQTWTNPYTKEVLIFPDQTYLTEIPKGKIVKETSTYQEWHDYITTVTDKIGVDVGLQYGGKDLAKINFMRSHGKFDELISGGVNNFATEDRYLPFYQLDLWPDSDINAHLSHLIAGLPNTISNANDQALYTKFIESVGTHFSVSAQFGGFLNFTSIFSATMKKSHSQEWVAYQIGLSLTWQEIKIGINYARNSSTDKLDEDYAEHSYNETDCLGGECFLIDDGQYDRWAASVGAMPGIIPAYQIMYPVTELIEGNDVKKATLKAAVIAYLSNPVPPGWKMD